MSENSVITKTEYLSGFQYKGSMLQFFPHAEGYVNVVDNHGVNSYNYVFNYTDHLGNIRLSYGVDPDTQSIKILEENHYYAFGLKHTNYNSDKLLYQKGTSGGVVLKGETPTVESPYKYKYNGKELQTELGLNLYDYGARNYDPALGRWMNIDPLAEKYHPVSQYVYTLNNPIFFIDPDGMRVKNGDEVRRKDAEENYNRWKKSLHGYAEFLGISADASRKEWKKAALAKNGEDEWERAKNFRNKVSNAKNELDKATKATEKSEEKINILKDEAPILFEMIDNLSIDIYISSKDYLPGNDGQNNTMFDETDPNNVTLTSLLVNHLGYIPNSTEIVIANYVSQGRTTLEVIKHEIGHADYIIRNIQSYYEWLKENKLLYNNHDGHKNDDPSGKRAVDFGKKNFKRN